MIYPMDGRCVNCGSSLPNSTTDSVKCEYCDSEYQIINERKETQGFVSDNMPQIIELHQKANALHEKNKYSEEISILQEAIALDNTVADTWIRLGRVYRVLGHYDKTHECYNKAISLNPEDLDLSVNIGVLLINEGKINEAVNYLEKAYNLCPTNGLYAANLAFCYAHLGNKQKGLDLLEKAKKLGYSNYYTLKKRIKAL